MTYQATTQIACALAPAAAAPVWVLARCGGGPFFRRVAAVVAGVAGALGGITAGPAGALFWGALAAIAAHDSATRTIPPLPLAAMAVSGLAMNAGAPLGAVACGAGVGAGCLALSWLAEAAGARGAFGLGDVLLMGALGLMIGPNAESWGRLMVALTCVLAALLAWMKARGSDTAAPFAPILAVAMAASSAWAMVL